MIEYTDRLATLMADVVARVPTLSFIDTADLLVFARFGRSRAAGAFATCHCLGLPPSEPAHYSWRDEASGSVTRRSEWFVTKSPTVTVRGRRIKYLISFALPRFCDQGLDQSHKERLYPRADAWMAKLDTVVHELYHIDPEMTGIRRIERGDGRSVANSHGHRFFEEVAALVRAYLDSRPDPAVFDFLRHDFATLEAQYGGVAATSFRGFPSFPRRYIERLAVQLPCASDAPDVEVEPIGAPRHQTAYTEGDLCVRQFSTRLSRPLMPKGRFRAA